MAFSDSLQRQRQPLDKLGAWDSSKESSAAGRPRGCFTQDAAVKQAWRGQKLNTLVRELVRLGI